MTRIVKIAIALTMLMGWLGTAHATTLSYNATADNAFYMYLSTDPSVQGTEIVYGDNWKVPWSKSVTLTPGVAYYLQVKGINWGYQAGFIGDFSISDANFHFANGSQYLMTNPTEWFVSATGFNSGVNDAHSYGYNNSWPWNVSVPGGISGIDQDAQWIWTTASSWPADGSHLPVYFSIPIYASVPIPGAALLFGSGLIGLWGLRRKLTK
jgi:hypothetical protein